MIPLCIGSGGHGRVAIRNRPNLTTTVSKNTCRSVMGLKFLSKQPIIRRRKLILRKPLT